MKAGLALHYPFSLFQNQKNRPYIFPQIISGGNLIPPSTIFIHQIMM